jgi:hypothetical protein
MQSAFKVASLIVIAGIVSGAWHLLSSHDEVVASSPKLARPIAQATRTVAPASPASAASVNRAPLPDAGKSFAATERILAERAHAGDTEAAIRLFRDGNLCYRARGAEQTLRNRTNQGRLDSAIEELSAGPEASLLVEIEDLDRLQSDLIAAEKAGDLCNGTHGEILDGRMYWYAEQAAKAGDANAASCFVGGAFLPPTFPSDASIHEDFRKNVLPIAQEQLQRGNVAMVTLLASYYDDSVGLMSYVRPRSDIAKSYTYKKLISLISSDATSSVAQEQLQLASRALTPEQIAAGDAEAAHLFDAHFGRKQRIPASSETCE